MAQKSKKLRSYSYKQRSSRVLQLFLPALPVKPFVATKTPARSFRCSLTFACLILISVLSYSQKPQIFQQRDNPFDRKGHLERYLKNLDRKQQKKQPLTDSVLTEIGQWQWGPCYAVDVQGNYAYIGNGTIFQVLDLSNETSPRIVGEYITRGLVVGIHLRDSLAFVDAAKEFLVLDIKNPENPFWVASLGLYPPGITLAVEDSLAYITTEDGGLQAIDISDPIHPHMRGWVDAGGWSPSLAAKGHYAYISAFDSPELLVVDATDPDNLSSKVFDYCYGCNISGVSDSLLFVGPYIYNISFPDSPYYIGSFNLPTAGTYPYTVCTFGSHAYIVTNDGWLISYDITDPRNALLRGKMKIQQRGIDVQSVATGQRFYTSLGSGMLVVDVSNPDSLREKSFFVAGGDGPGGVAVQDQYAYVALGTAGLAILDVSIPTKPVKTGGVLMNGDPEDVAIQGNYAYLVAWGLWTVDVSNPQSPQLTSSIPIGHGLAIAVEKQRAYVAVYDSGVVIFDLSNPASPVRVGMYSASVFQSAVSDSLLFIPGGSGLMILNVSDPHNIVEVSTFPIYTSRIVINAPFAFIATDTGLGILDISNPASPSLLSMIGAPFGPSGVEYVALSGNYLYLSGDSLVTVDISNALSPKVVDSYSPPYGGPVAAQGRFVYYCDLIAGFEILQNSLAPALRNYPVNEGWNLLSLPSHISGMTKNQLFPNASSEAFTYQSGYVIIDTLTNGNGYWIKFGSAQHLVIPDFPMYTDTIPVNRGWNLVGSLSASVPDSTIWSIPAGIVTSSFFGYDSSYYISEMLQPGKGYWVRVDQNGILIVSSGGMLNKSSRIRITPTDELPPSPPNGVGTIHRSAAPNHFILYQNYPNPFNPVTAIEFYIPKKEQVKVEIFNVLGQEVATVWNGTAEAGVHTVNFDASGLASAVYIYKASTPEASITKKMVIVR